MLHRKRLETFSSSYSFFNILALLVGLLGGLGAVAFRWLIASFSLLFFGTFKEIFSFLGDYYIIVIPTLGGLIIGPIIYFFARETKGHGVPEVIEAVLLKGGRIRARVAALKALVSSICIGSGGSVGREGPIVQIGSSVGSSLGQFFKLHSDQVKILVGCGAAAGIAATFNAPIAGVFFSMEIILGEFKTRSFIPIVIASVFATAVSRHFLGDFPSFLCPPYSMQNPLELIFCLLLGIIAGLMAIFQIKTLYFAEDFFDKIKFKPYLLPALGGLILGIAGFFLPHIFGVGYGENLPGPLVNTIDLILQENFPWFIMLLLMLAKPLALALTIGTGGSGGVFAPSLFIGAVTGGSFGFLVHLLFPEITSSYGFYALIGMAAVVAGSTRATLTAIIQAFEMTGDYKIILPLMFACVISDWMVVKFLKTTIYTEKIKRRGIKVLPEKESDILSETLVCDAMVKNPKILKENDSISKALELIQKEQIHGYPVLNIYDELTGILTHHEVQEAILRGDDSKPVKEFMVKDLKLGYPQESLQVTLMKMIHFKIGHLPVVNRDNPKKMLGIITKTDILNAYCRIEKKREEEVF